MKVLLKSGIFMLFVSLLCFQNYTEIQGSARWEIPTGDEYVVSSLQPVNQRTIHNISATFDKSSLWAVQHSVEDIKPIKTILRKTHENIENKLQRKGFPQQSVFSFSHFQENPVDYYIYGLRKIVV